MASRRLDLAIFAKMVDQVSGPARKVGAGFKGMRNEIRATRAQMKGLEQQRRQVDRLSSGGKKLLDTRRKRGLEENQIAQLNEQRKAAEAAGRSTARLDDRMAAAQKRANKFATAEKKLTAETRDLRKRLREAGVQGNSFAQMQDHIKREADGATRALDRQRRIVTRAEGAYGRLARTGRNVRRVFAGVMLGGALAMGATGSFASTASQFEDFRVTLQVLEGDATKAGQSLDWVSEFVAKTPFQLDQVAETFVKLRSYGLQPMNGSLKTLGDTAAAMNKGIMQSAEALADAMTGENERLKEFGINASVSGDTTRFNFSDNAGVQRFIEVERGNRKAIESALMQIWGSKFGGTMDMRSQTFSGIISNLRDQFVRFQVMVMDSGPFSRLKDRAAGLLELVDQMARDGRLLALAERIGAHLVKFLDVFYEFAQWAMKVGTLLAAGLQHLAEFAGGWQELFTILLALKGLAIAADIIAIGVAFAAALPKLKAAALLVASISAPVAILIGLLGTLAYLWVKNWDDIVGGGKLLYQDLVSGFETHVIAPFMGFINKMRTIGSDIITGLKEGFTSEWDIHKKAFALIGEDIKNSFARVLGIQSPSKVFQGYGENIIQGLNQGLDRGKITGLADQVKRNGYSLALAGAMAATPAAAGNAAPVTAGGNTYHINAPVTIYGHPGMEAADIKTAVEDAVRKALASVSAGGSYYDGD